MENIIFNLFLEFSIYLSEQMMADVSRPEFFLDTTLG